VRVDVQIEAVGEPLKAVTDGPAYRAMAGAMQTAYGHPMSELGQGGSIPLCNVLAATYPDAEIILIGLEEPQARIHAPNESVHPRASRPTWRWPKRCSCGATRGRCAERHPTRASRPRGQVLTGGETRWPSETHPCSTPSSTSTRCR
jgi:hypothetical protein